MRGAPITTPQSFPPEGDPKLDPRAFRAFEHDGWQSVAANYHDSFAALTTQAIAPLLDAVGGGKGVRLLDVATGPGYVAAAAAERGAAVVGLDFSTAMVAEARHRHPGVKFREGDAEDLPFRDGTFDACVMSFGLLHLARPEQALREAYRILRPGGRIAFTVWAPPEKAVAFGIVLRAIEKHGRMDVPLPPGPPFFRFSTPQEASEALTGSGFSAPSVIEVAQVWRLDSPDALFRIMQRGSVRTGALLHAQSADGLKAIGAAIRDAACAFAKGDVIEFPMPCILASARKAWPPVPAP